MPRYFYCHIAATLIAAVAFTSANSHAQEKTTNALPLLYLRLTGFEDSTNPNIFLVVQPQAGDALVHELCRQAVLLASRETGKVVIRDEGMGDLQPEKNRKNAFIFNMKTNYLPGKSVSIQLGSESADNPNQLWDHKLALDKDKDTIQQLTEYLEEKSRTELDTIIKKELHTDVASPPVKLDLKAINSLLDDFTFLSQFEALRRLHASNTTREPATLAALAKGYAQLALLTRYHWTQQHRVCQARSLLYAQRLLALQPKGSGYSTLASCLSLVGYHKAALALFDRAEKDGEKLSSWASSAMLAAQFNFEALEAQSAKIDGPGSELPQFLAFRILAGEPPFRLQTMTAPATQLGMKIVEHKPESYPVIHRLSMSNALGIKQQMTQVGQEVLIQTLPARMSSMNGLPPSVKASLQGADMIRECPLAMMKEGETDNLEPSWSNVGQTVMQTYFQQVQQRAEFMHSFWVVPTKEYLDEVMPLLAKHPQASVINVAAGDNVRGSWPFTHLKTGDNRCLDLAQYCRVLLGDKGGNGIFWSFLHQHPYNGDDLAMMEQVFKDRGYQRTLGTALIAESPYHPAAPAILLRTGDSNVLAKLPEDHEKRYGSHISYLYEYGQWLMRNQKLGDAEKILTKLVKINPNSDGYDALANYYLKVNNRVKWEATLEEYLTIPDPGLQPARARLELAEYHASKKNWEKAKSLAAEAAETYAAWALFRASRVFAQAGDFATSETYIKNMSTRYNDSTDQWFRWCMRYDKGNKKAAYALVKGTMERNGALSRGNNMLLGFCNEVMNQPKEAIEYYTKVYTGGINLDVAVRAAMLEADQGNKDARDNWIIKALTPDKKQAGQRDYEAQLKITEIILQANKTGKAPEMNTIEEIVAGISEQFREVQYYHVGRLCEQLNDLDKAKLMYQKGMQPKSQDSWNYLLCQVRLRGISDKK